MRTCSNFQPHTCNVDLYKIFPIFTGIMKLISELVSFRQRLIKQKGLIMQNDVTYLEQLNQQFSSATTQDVIEWVVNKFGNKAALSTSLSVEDQVILHMIALTGIHVNVFTLDTGRLFPETYDLIDRTVKKYRIPIRFFFPERQSVEEMVSLNGINLFYDSIENRKKCCLVRKIDPLKRAFTGLDAWICGLRREQSVTRAQMQMFEWDHQNDLIKINPLIEWTNDQVWAYIRQHHVPYNTLYDKGFQSIGCQPCTRAVMAGEDVRAGRWWWENPESRECGLHSKK